MISGGIIIPRHRHHPVAPSRIHHYQRMHIDISLHGRRSKPFDALCCHTGTPVQL